MFQFLDFWVIFINVHLMWLHKFQEWSSIITFQEQIALKFETE